MPISQSMAMAMGDVSVVLGGRRVQLSNLEKPLFPSGFTKAQVIEYYGRVAGALLPHLRDRPLTLKRYPNGAAGKFFYEKNCPAHAPSWMRTTPVWSGHRGRSIQYCTVDDLASLVWVANLASIELHTSLSRAPRLDTPTMLVFDLDPGAPADLVDCARVALRLRQLLFGCSLAALAKTSGKKGMQVYVPLNTPARYDDTKAFAYAVARLLEAEQPARVTSVMKKERRAGRVFIDWSQNDEHKTTVCVYSLRAEDTPVRPTVSTPVHWDEIAQVARSGDKRSLMFETEEVIQRVERDGDLFAPLLSMEQRLPTLERLHGVTRHAEARFAGQGDHHVGGDSDGDSGAARLSAYAARRHFDVTPEPAATRAHPKKAAGEALRFMIHKHHARRLHYDLRLEIGGALASWAVPRGPSYNPADRRLAVETEDHPLEYGDFEGRIPDGEYGAGDSLIWDRGVWDTVPPGEAAEQRARGRLLLELRGEKLRGRWHLIRTGPRTGRRSGGATETGDAGSDGRKVQWLLWKASDEHANPSRDITAERPESVVSGRDETRGPARRSNRR